MFTSLPRGRCSDTRSSFDEAFIVTVDLWRQPFRAWFRADHGKNSRRSNGSALICLRIFQFDLFEAPSASHLADLCLIEDLNIFACLYTTREIIRHLVGNVFPANNKQNLGSTFGKKQCGLSRGVAASGDNNRFVAAKLTFHCRSRVVNAHILKLLAPFCIEAPVIRACCNQNGFSSENCRATFDLETGAVFVAFVVSERKNQGRGSKFRAESVSLKLSKPS